MSYSFCDANEVEAMNGVFRPIRRALGGTAFGINQEDLPPNGDQYPEHTEVESGQEEVFYVLSGSGRITVDGEDVELKPGRYVLVSPESKRKVWPGPDGMKLIIVGAPVGRGYEVPS
jgi:uncharacterized cupin superfamily protein